jgi:hypothetical protein
MPGTGGTVEAGDKFGNALAVGDFNRDGYDDLAIGVFGEDFGNVGPDGHGINAGVVHIVYGSAFGLPGEGNLLLTLGEYNQSGSFFGTSLTVGDFNGDNYPDLAVGAPGWDAGGTKDAGAVAVFLGGVFGLSGHASIFLGQWQPRVPGTPEQNDRLGNSLSAEDFDRDGFDDLAIGISREDIGNTVDAGAVAVLYGAPDAVNFGSRSVLLLDQLVGADDRFGATLTAGDFNGDTYPDLAIGHPHENAGATNAGAVTVVYGSRYGVTGGVRQYWPADVHNLPGEPKDFEYFGLSLATADFDGNGIDDLAIGTPHDRHDRLFQTNLYSAGQVTVLYGSHTGLFVGARSDWHQDKSGVESSRGESDHFGQALSVGDFNHDDFADLVVSVPGEDLDDKQDAGMLHIFYGTAQGLSSDPKLGRETFTQGLGTDGSRASEPYGEFGSVLP